MMRQKKYSMNRKDANRTLQNVFEACDAAPNSVSFTTLVIRTKANTTLVSVCKWISVVALILVILSPIAFYDHGKFDTTGIEQTEKISVLSHKLYNDHFEMVLSGNDIDYGGIYCKKLNGTVVIPSSADAETGIVEIPFDGDSLNIYIPCSDGSVTQALLSK